MFIESVLPRSPCPPAVTNNVSCICLSTPFIKCQLFIFNLLGGRCQWSRIVEVYFTSNSCKSIKLYPNGCAFFCFFSGNYYNSVHGSGPPNRGGCRIFQNSYGFNIIWVDCIVASLNRKSIYNNKRLLVCKEG